MGKEGDLGKGAWFGSLIFRIGDFFFFAVSIFFFLRYAELFFRTGSLFLRFSAIHLQLELQHVTQLKGLAWLPVVCENVVSIWINVIQIQLTLALRTPRYYGQNPALLQAEA